MTLFRAPLMTLTLAAFAALLSAASRPGYPQDPPGVGGKTLSGSVVEVQKEFNRLIFRAADGDRLRTYSIPIADDVKVRLGERDAKIVDLRPGTRVQVTTAGPDGGRVVAVQASRAVQKTDPMSAGKKEATPTAAATNLSLAYPTGDRSTSVLLIETKGPERVRVGEPYEYEIRLTNLTKNTALEKVRVYQQETDAFSIDSSEPSREGDDEPRWTVKRLLPGAAETIRVRATGEEEGLAASCIRVKYEPTVCMVTQFVKPDVQLTKEAPNEAHICDPLAFRYVVRNAGSAAARKVRVKDELPDGLKTEDDKKEVAFDVGDLPAGQSREFTARVVADKAGTYSSRAVAETGDGGKVQSKKTETTVREPRLSVSIDGPEAEYVNQPASYTIEVTNDGDAPARQARLALELDEKVRLDRAGRVGDDGPQARVADGQPIVWDLGTLRPDEKREVKVTLTGVRKGDLKHVATVTSDCARDRDDARAEATAETEMLTLPALLLALVDNADPVRVGNEVTYTLTVVNQGTGADRNVEVAVELPEELEFKDSDGPTDAKADGRKVTFGKVEKLEPGERATWSFRATAKKDADVRTRAELTSDYLKDPASSVEPTRLVEQK